MNKSMLATNENDMEQIMNNVNYKMGATEWVLLLILSVLWGGSFFFVGVAVKALPPFTIVALRVGLAAIALNFVVRATGLRMPTDQRVWGAFFGMGLLNNMIPFCLIVWGQTHIASGLASIFNATTPIFTVIVAHAFTKDEKLTGGRLFGIVAGFTGAAVIIGLDRLDNLGTNTLAQLAVLGAALSYAFAGVYGRRFKSYGVSPMITATGQVTASTIFLVPLVAFVDQPWSLAMPSSETWAAMLGLVCPLLPYSCDSGCNKSIIGHIPNSGQCYFTRCAISWRATRVERFYWYGTYIFWFGRHRWTAIWFLAKEGEWKIYISTICVEITRYPSIVRERSFSYIAGVVRVSSLCQLHALQTMREDK
jgi:drug/metabolite transporter (DMT)-like permease